MFHHRHLHGHHGGYRNNQANYNSDLYAMMTNSVPSQTHVHLHRYNDWIDPLQHIRNTPANHISDAYAMITNRPPPPWMISNNLVIYGSTISPHTIHEQQMIDDNHVIYASTISPHTIHYQQQMMIDDDLNRNTRGTLSEEAISKNIKTRAATEEDATEICIVCQYDLHEEGNDEFIATLHCGHGYHANCIRRWVRQKNVCPLCNAVAIVLPSEDM